MKKVILLVCFIAISSLLTTFANTLIITVTDFAFAPNGSNPPTATVGLGDTVKWVWGNGSHTTTSTTIPSGAASWNATIASTSLTYIYVPVMTGTYHYGCPAHASVGMNGIFYVNCGSGPVKPVVTSSNGSSACQDGTIHLSTPVQPGGTYQWYNGINPVANTTNALNVTSSGSYTVTVRRCSVDSGSAPFLVTYYPNPAPSFTETHSGLSYNFVNTTPLLTSNTYVWTFSDGSPNQTTTNASRTFASHGSYTVSLKATTTISSCFASTNKVINTKLGVGMISGESYSITPNPATSILLVNTTIDASLTLSDLNGRKLKPVIGGDGRHFRIDVSELAPGIYLMRIATSKGSAVEKITVMH